MKGMDPRLRGDDVVARSMLFADANVEKNLKVCISIQVIPAKAGIHASDFKN
jgi:hypothetical protein